MKTNNLYFWAMLILFAMLAFTTYALRNPFAVYCSALGYEYATRETAYGTEGFCKVSGSVECSAYDFLMGNCGTEYNYCSKQGYQQRPGKGLECGTDTQYAQCLMCVLRNGSAKEVTILMNLSFKEGVCGDGACVIGENYQNCPKDCPSGPKTIKYKYWDDLANVTTTTAAANEEVHVSTTAPAANNAGSYASSFYIIVIVLVLLIVLFVGLRTLRNRGKE